MKKTKYLLHGFFFALSSAIIIYVSNSASIINIHPLDIIYPTIFALIVYLLFLLIGYLISRSLETAGLFASILVLGLFYIWPVFTAILIIYLISFLLIKILFKKIKFLKMYFILNIISVILFGIILVLFINLLVGVPRVSRSNTIHPIGLVLDSILTIKDTPDIYYIILDGYGREDMLQTVLDYDNTSFIDALEQRGFFIAVESKSNYPRTLLSLSSSLNMQYLDTMSPVMGDSSLRWPVTDTIQHSEVRNILENIEYKTIFFASGWDYTDIRDGDFYEAPYPIMLKNFENPFLNFTNLSILRYTNRLGIAYPSYDTHRQIISYAFSKLPEVAVIPGPKFVFAHIIAPHPPYVFSRSGDPVNPDYPYTLNDPPKNSGGILASRNNYIDQLIFVNKEILRTIDGILENSKDPPVIILQGDHGSGIFVDYGSIENSCLYERYSILNAYYLPGVDKTSIPEDLSPVNSFRYIFNEYFKTEIELLPNRQYFSTSKNFYQFTDITGMTESACETNLVSTP